VAFDQSRAVSNEVADYMRRHGPFVPGRLPMGEMEYTTLKDVLENVARALVAYRDIIPTSYLVSS
jgi:fructose 1,6-bisphosphate aldolase/phosphatase